MDAILPTRILLIDENDAIHQDFRKVFLKDMHDADCDHMKFDLLSELDQPKISHIITPKEYLIDSAFQGETGFEMVKKALEEEKPYSLAVIDMHIAPHNDGIFTIQRLWDLDPDLQIVLCSTRSDSMLVNIGARLEQNDSYLFLKKPFDRMEIRQAAASLIKKWELIKQNQQQTQHVENLIFHRTQALSQSVSVFKATLEATREAILGIDIHQNTVNAYNHNMLTLWNLDEASLKGDVHILFKNMAEKTDSPHLFMQQMCNLHRSIDNFCKEWTLLSGKQVELYVQNQYTDDHRVGYVLNFRDITRNKQLEAELLHQATHDNLTGLPNRALLQDRIQQAIAQTARSGLSVGILLLDIDKFKSINDTYGHHCGDDLLKIVSKKLNQFIQESETATRLGSDEFVLVLPRVKIESLVIKANELLNMFMSPLLINGHALNITAGIGITVYPKDGHDMETLLKNADHALYQAKTQGKNNFQFYASEFSEYLRARELLIADLQTALTNDQFAIYYQPLVNLKDKKISGVEALLRWNHPTRGLLYPAEFLDAIEESGLMPAIGEWVLKTACAQAKIWHDRINPNLAMAINISPTQFKQKNFLASVKKILAETGVNPGCLEFEITENLILNNSGDVVKKMYDLKKIGVKFSMDDFGTGYASLSYLKSFPFDKIKIDKSFVSGVMDSRVDRSIIEAILMMAKRIGVTVLAEGVSTKEDLEFLQQHATPECQGFYFSPAVDKDDCSRLLGNDEIL